MMRDRVSQLGDDNGIDREGVDRRRAATAERARSHGLCCPPPMAGGRGGAALLGMVCEAGAIGRAGYDVELTVTIEEYE